MNQPPFPHSQEGSGGVTEHQEHIGYLNVVKNVTRSQLISFSVNPTSLLCSIPDAATAAGAETLKYLQCQRLADVGLLHC